MHYKISFIIASIDRDEGLHKCIDSIEKAHEYRQDIPIEILVVFQKANQKKDLRNRIPNITSIYYINELGLSVARNFAINKSTGDFLVFLDDDASVKENFLDILYKNIETHRNINAFCGRLIDPLQQVPFTHIFNNDRVKKLNKLDYQYFMGSSHVLSRRVFNKVGCYDERFGVGSKYFGSEETDIFFRLKMANEQVLYLPELIFFHRISLVPSGYVYKYAYAVGAVLTKSCMKDKINFIIYCTIVSRLTIKALIRILQKIIFGGIYIEKAKRYHYFPFLKGTFKGIMDYARNEHKHD